MDEAENGEVPERHDRRAEKLKEGPMTEQDIIICVHGSNRPSTKNMRDYLTQRYSKVATNGKRKQGVMFRGGR